MQRGDIDRAIRGMYDDIDATVRAKGPTCWTSGKCCNFNEYGHRMYVTGLEIAWVLEQIDHLQRDQSHDDEQHDRRDVALSVLAPDTDKVDSVGACSYQIDKLCSIHTVRPLGCRVFFCQEGTQHWQQTLYEHVHLEVRALHHAFALPYAYMEWRAGLSAAAGAR